MPAIPPIWRKWLYAVSCASVPLLVALGWVTDSVAAAILGIANAVFIGALATANVPKPDAE